MGLGYTGILSSEMSYIAILRIYKTEEKNVICTSSRTYGV